MAKKTIDKTQPMPAPPPVEDHDEDLDEEEDLDEDEHDDEDEDEEDDEDDHAGHSVIAHSTRTVPGKMPPAPVVATHEPQREDTTWWLPHAVLGTLIVVGVLGFFGVFTSTLHPLFVKMGLLSSAAPAASSAGGHEEPPKPAPTPSQKPAQPTPPIVRPTAAPQPKPTVSAVAPPPQETFGAKHIVVAYKGALNANAKITRSKEDAKKRANEVHGKLKKGGKWDELVAQYSDEEAAGAPRFGNLGRFTAATFDKAFIDAVRKLKKDEMSDVVETPMGFHVIVRTE